MQIGKGALDSRRGLRKIKDPWPPIKHAAAQISKHGYFQRVRILHMCSISVTELSGKVNVAIPVKTSLLQRCLKLNPYVCPVEKTIAQL